MKRQHIVNNKELTREHLDSYFIQLKRRLRPIPKRGWIHTIRKALLMQTSQLGKRLGLPQSNVSIFESAERSKKITLKSLERIAKELDCDLYYAFIPKRSLGATLSERVKKLYKHDQKLLEHQMRLEGQGTKSDNRRALEMAMLVLREDKRLWEELD